MPVTRIRYAARRLLPYAAPLALAAAAHGCEEDGAHASVTDGAVDASAANDADDWSPLPPTNCAPGDPGPIDEVRSAPFGQNVCDLERITFVVICAFDPNAVQTDCAERLKDDSNRLCADCMLTDAARPGPIIVEDGLGYLNVGGCIQHFMPVGACGDRFATFQRCARKACRETCPLANGLQAHEDCLIAAEQGVCAPLGDGPERCARDALGPDGGATACAVTSDFFHSAEKFGLMFCGPGVASDAGTDGD
jgi:hypothetical protein